MTADARSREVGCDLLVVGGGAAGLAGAVTAAFHDLDVVVAEKAPVLGGATAWSGGWMWAPLNPLSQADGIADIHGHLPGAGTGGRSVGPKPLNARRISKELRAMLRPQLYETSFLGMGIMAGPDLSG